MTGPGPFEDYDFDNLNDGSEEEILRSADEDNDYAQPQDEDENEWLRQFNSLRDQTDDPGTIIREPITQEENRALSNEVSIRNFPSNPAEGSSVAWNIDNSPTRRFFERAERNFGGDPIESVRFAAREFDERFASLSVRTQAQAINQFVSNQANRLKAVTSSFDELLANRERYRPPASGFLRRPGASTYYSLFNEEMGQPMGLRMTYYQLQQRDVLQGLLNRQSSVEAIAQGYTHRSITSEETLQQQRVRMDIALGNEAAAGVLNSGPGFRKSMDLVTLEDAAFHPKMAYSAEDVKVGDFMASSVATPSQAIFGTQNITPALSGKVTTEEVLVLNSKVKSMGPVLQEIRAATDALLETQRRVKNGQIAGSSFRETSSQLYTELTGRRQLNTGKRFVEMNSRIQDRMLEVLGEAARGTKRVVMSVQYLESLFAESPESASTYGSFQREMRGILETLAKTSRLKVAMQAGRLGNQAGYYEMIERWGKNPNMSGGDLLNTLLKQGAIDLAPTMFMHSKSFAVFDPSGQLNAFSMMSANISRQAAEKNIEVGLFFESGGERDASDILRHLDEGDAISDYYLNVMTKGFREGNNTRQARFLSELKASSSMSQSAFDRLRESFGKDVQLSKRYRLPSKEQQQKGFTPNELLTGMDITLNHKGRRAFGFSVSVGSTFSPAGEVPVVYLNESSRMLTGSVYTNRSSYNVEVGGRVVKAGESIRLDAIETLAGLVNTMQRGIDFESRIGAVNEAYSRSFGDNKQGALKALDHVISRTFLSAAQMETGGAFEVGRGQLNLFDTLSYLRENFNPKVYGRIINRSRSLLERYAEDYGQDLDERLKARLTPKRRAGLNALFPAISRDEAPSRAVLAEAMSQFEEVVGDTRYGGEAFADLRRRAIDESETGSAIYQKRMGRASRDIFKQVTASFFAPHEMGYSASQGMVNMPAYAITDELVHTLSGKASDSKITKLDAAILNPDLLQHGMTLGSAGQYVRGIASTAVASNRQLSENLGGIIRAEGGAARVYETQSLFQMMPGLGIIRKGEFAQELAELSTGNEVLTRRFKQLEDELFGINQEGINISQPGVRETLLLMPYSKTEQVSQRLKNLTSTRPALDVSNDLLQEILNLGIGSKRDSREVLLGDDVFTGNVKTSLPEYQYQALRSYMESLDPTLSVEQRERAVLKHFRNEALDPTNVLRGVVGGTAPRRVLHNIGISTMSDFGYINAGYDKAYGYSHRVRVVFNPRGIGSADDTASTISKIERALGAGTFATAKSMPLGDLANEALQQQYNQLYEGRVRELGDSGAHRFALQSLRQKFTRLDFPDDPTGIVKAHLKAGMYRLPQGDTLADGLTALNPELVGELHAGDSAFTLLGVETYTAGRRSPVKVRIPAFSRREYDGITAFVGNVTTNVEGGRVTMQADTINMMKFRSGLRPGEAAAKGPLLAIDRDFFDMYNEIAQNKVLAGGVSRMDMLPKRVRDEQIFAMLPRSAVKGFNYESGLALLEDVEGAGLLKMLKTSAGGESVAQALGLMLLGNRDVREAMAASLGRRSAIQEMSVRLMGKAPKQLREIDKTLTGGAGEGVDRMAAVAGGIYSLAQPGEGETLRGALERTVSEALTVRNGEYTAEALRSQELLAERAYQLFSNVREKHAVQIGERYAFQEKGPVVKGAAALAYLMSSSQQLFSSPNATAEYGSRPMIELNLSPETGSVGRFLGDESFRDRVQGLALGLGVQLPRVEDYTRMSAAEKAQLNKELEAKLEYMYSIFQMNRPIEMMMEISPSKSLVAAGMQDVVKLEYQYTTALTKEALSQYLPSETRDTITDLQGAMVIISEAMDPSTRRRGLSEVKEQALDFRLSNLTLTELGGDKYSRALIAAAKIADSYSPITQKSDLRLGQNTSALEDVLGFYAKTGRVEGESFRRYEDFTTIAQMDIGVKAGDIASRADILSRAQLGVASFNELGITAEGKKQYISDFYEVFQRRAELVSTRGTRQLESIDAQLSGDREDYKVVLSQFGDQIERQLQQEGKLVTKESLFDLFERNKVWKTIEDSRLESVRSSVVDFYNSYDRIEQSRAAQLGEGYRSRSVIEAAKQESELEAKLLRNPTVNLFLKGHDQKFFSLVPSTLEADDLAERQRGAVRDRLLDYKRTVFSAIEESGSLDRGENYLRGLRAIREYTTSRLRITPAGETSERLRALQAAVEKTTYIEMPSLERVDEQEGRAIIRLSHKESSTVGVRLGLDVMERMSLVFPEYTSEILLNQQRLEELRRRSEPLLQRLQTEQQTAMTSDEVTLLTELRQTMLQSTEDVRELATTDTVRQMMGDRLSARGSSFVPVSTFLAGRREAAAGERLSRAARGQGEEGAGFGRFLKAQFKAIKASDGADRLILAKGLADTLNAFTRTGDPISEDGILAMTVQGRSNRFVSADGFAHRVVSQITGQKLSREGYVKELANLENKFYLGTALVNRGGAPAMVATTTAGTPMEIITMGEISKRAEHENTYLKVDPKMGSTALMISALSHNFTQLGDYDGDMFQVVLTDIARLTSEISKSSEELVLLERRLGERLNDDEEARFIHDQRREALGRVNRTNQLLREKLQIQDAMRRQAEREGRAGVRQMVSAYTGLPGELFGEDRPISDLRSMTLIQQYRDTLSGLYDNAPNLEKGNRIVEQLAKASQLSVNGDRIEGIDYSQLDEADVDLIRGFVRHAVDTGRLQQGETNPQRIVKEFSTVHGAIANLQSSMTNLNKGLENLQGQVMSSNMFADVQGAVGFAGSSLLGKTYNTIVPLMYATTQQLAMQRVLAREGPQGVFKQQLVQNLRSIGASEEAIRAAEGVQTGASAAEAGRGAMQSVERSIGFLGTMQQLMRDALKPKGDGGIGDAMQQFGLEGKLAQAMDEQERAGIMKEFVLSKIGTELDSPSAGESNKMRQKDKNRSMEKTAFGLMYLLNEYAHTESMDELMGYKEGRGTSVFSAELRSSYNEYQNAYKNGDLDGEMLNKEDFMARLLTKQIAAAQTNFIVGTVIAGTPDLKGLTKSIDQHYLNKELQLRQQISEASNEQEVKRFTAELESTTGYRNALQVDGLKGLVYHNLTEGGGGINERHVKYMREFGLMAREIQLNKSLAGALDRNFEMGLVAAGSMIQRGKAEAETLSGIMSHIQQAIVDRTAVDTPELQAMDAGERAAYLYRSGYLRALNIESIFPGLEQLPAESRGKVTEEFVRALAMPTEPVEVGQVSPAGETTLGNGMKTNLLQYLEGQMTAYEKALGLSSKFQTAKAAEAQAVASGDEQSAQLARAEAQRLQQQEVELISSVSAPAVDTKSLIPTAASVEATQNATSAALKFINSQDLEPQLRADIKAQTQQREERIKRTTSIVEETFGRERRRSETAEVAGLLAGPIAFGLMQGDVQLDERAALFGLDVIQSMSSMSQLDGSVTSSQFLNTGVSASADYQHQINKRAREAAMTFQYKRVANMMRNSDSSIEGALQGVATESLYQSINMAVSKGAQAIESTSELVSKTVAGRGAVAAGAEIIGGVLAMSAARALLGNPVTPRESAINEEIEQILRFYSTQAYAQSEQLFMERLRSDVVAEDSAGEELDVDVTSGGAPSEIELGIEMGTIGFDEEDSHRIELVQSATEDSFSPLIGVGIS